MSSRRCVAPNREPDLTWLFCEAPGELGLRSSHGTLVDLALAGVTSGGTGGVPSTWLPEGRVRAATEERRMRRVLAALAPDHVVVLWLAYGPQPWPAEVRRPAIYGPWPGVLLLAPTAHTAFERAVAARRKKARVGGQRITSITIDEPMEPHQRLLGPARDTSLDAVAAMVRRGLGEWLRLPSTSKDTALMARLRADARDLVNEAYAAYRAAGGRAPQAEFEELPVRSAQRRARLVVHVEELSP